MELVVTSDGCVRCVYAEAVDLTALGTPEVTRGSYVEPQVGGTWTADLSPVAGPVLGPFAQRSQALAAEVAWLREHWLLSNA